MRLPPNLPGLLPLLEVATVESPVAGRTLQSPVVETSTRSYQPQFLLQLDVQTPGQHPYLFHRGTCTECRFATFFSLIGDQLFADGELLTLSGDSTCQPLLADAGEGSIRHGFSFEAGVLQWKHPNFQRRGTGFCLSSATNKVLVVFDEGSRPADCTPTNLIYVPYDECFPDITLSIQTTRTSDGSIGGVGGQGLTKWTDTKLPTNNQNHHGPPRVGVGQTLEPNRPLWPGSVVLPIRHGKDGKDGSDGDDGRDGRDGRDGKDGIQGEPGPPGPAGLDGTHGVNGTDGRDGPQGLPGTPGVNGTDGEQGQPGPTGPAGAVGAAGPQGLPGLDGATGEPGQPGPAGAQGLPGVDGSDGQPGPAGPQGLPGVDGEDGAPGEQGPVGPPGPPGSAGFASQYGYLGCYLTNNDGNFGLTPFSFQQVLTTSIDDCAEACTDLPSGRSLHFTLGTNAQGDSICTCGNNLVANIYPHTGQHFQCNQLCTFSDTTEQRYCGGTFAGVPVVSVFGAI